MSGSAKDTVEKEALRRFDSSFRYLHGKALGYLQHFGWKSLDILVGIQYSCIKKSSYLVLSWVLSALPVQLSMPALAPNQTSIAGVGICFTVTIFLVMTCYQLHSAFSGSK